MDKTIKMPANPAANKSAFTPFGFVGGGGFRFSIGSIDDQGYHKIMASQRPRNKKPASKGGSDFNFGLLLM